VARKVRLRLRPGRALFGSSNEGGASFQHSAGDEFLVLYEGAVKLLAGKGRRTFEILEVVEEARGPEDLPRVVLESGDEASDQSGHRHAPPSGSEPAVQHPWRPEAGFAGREAMVEDVASLRRRRGPVGEPGVPPRSMEVES